MIPRPSDVKSLAFKLREKQRESEQTAKKGRESSVLIDLEVLPSRKTREEPLKWVGNLLRDDEKVLLNPNEWSVADLEIGEGGSKGAQSAPIFWPCPFCTLIDA